MLSTRDALLRALLPAQPPRATPTAAPRERITEQRESEAGPSRRSDVPLLVRINLNRAGGPAITAVAPHPLAVASAPVTTSGLKDVARGHRLARVRPEQAPSVYDVEYKLSAKAQEQLRDVLASAWAPKTIGQYASGLGAFLEWCDAERIPLRERAPPAAPLISIFLASTVGRIKQKSAAGYASALHAWCRMHGWRWPFVKDDDRLKTIYAGLKRNEPQTERAKRPPVQYEHLIAFRAALNLEDPYHAALWAAAVLAFWGMARLGAMLCDAAGRFDPVYLPAGDAWRFAEQSGGRALLVHLPWDKVNKHRGRTLRFVPMPSSVKANPFAALANHVRLNGTQRGRHLFNYIGRDGQRRNLTRGALVHKFNEIILDAGFHVPILGHAFRIGGATAMLLAGLPPDTVKVLGEWRSDAYLLYWRMVEAIMARQVAANASGFERLAGG